MKTEINGVEILCLCGHPVSKHRSMGCLAILTRRNHKDVAINAHNFCKCNRSILELI